MIEGSSFRCFGSKAKSKMVCIDFHFSFEVEFVSHVSLDYRIQIEPYSVEGARILGEPVEE
jgi:hypothetical protein